MASMLKVKGMDKVLRNLKNVQRIDSNKYARGLKKAGEFLQRKSMQMVPVHKGNLKAGAFTRSVGFGFNTVVTVGYVADYAVYVHENIDAVHGLAFNIKYAKEISTASTSAQKKMFFNRGKNQQAKFLETPLRQNVLEIFKIVARG